MNEENRISMMFAELNPPENDTAGAVLSRLHDKRRAPRRKLRPLIAVALAALLLCGTALALTMAGVVDLYPSDELIYGGMPCLFRADWVPDRQLPLSDELLAWMEPYLQAMPAETDPNFETAYVSLDDADMLAPLLENAGLYRCPQLTSKPVDTRLSILDAGDIKYASIKQNFDYWGKGAYVGSLDLLLVYGNGTEKPGEIVGTAIAMPEPDTLERGEYGTYVSQISGVSASYCFTHAKNDLADDIVSMDVWVPDGAALWNYHICGSDTDAQTVLMQELIDSLER
ncbi:MAG: hypothetical protein VB086_00025 [Clostridiaceae bacterium]|nr:hypothetical protein [Clostridiaceae bacterium]